MLVEYNGVLLQQVTLNRVERTAIYTPDETSLLYTEWAVSCSAVWHPSIPLPGGATSTGHADNGGTSVEPRNSSVLSAADVKPTNVGVSPAPAYFATNGVNPLGRLGSRWTMPGAQGAIVTDKALQFYLSMPRKKLRIWAEEPKAGGGVTEKVLLESPRPGPTGLPMPRDAKTGPIVQANVISAAYGQGQTFAVNLEIKTWVPPCPYGSDRLVLAHRWQMEHGHDADYYLTRTVTGEIHFHGGVKDEFGVRPDVIARQLFHPIPLGFRRSLGPIARSPDGLVVRYSFADTDQMVVFDPHNSGATQMSIVEKVSYGAPFSNVFEVLNRPDVGAAARAGGLIPGLPGVIARQFG